MRVEPNQAGSAEKRQPDLCPTRFVFENIAPASPAHSRGEAGLGAHHQPIREGLPWTCGIGPADRRGLGRMADETSAADRAETARTISGSLAAQAGGSRD